MSEGRRPERALGGVKNENVAWFDTELEKLPLLALLAHFEHRDGIKLSIKPWERESAAVMFSHRHSYLEFSRCHKASKIVLPSRILHLGPLL